MLATEIWNLSELAKKTVLNKIQHGYKTLVKKLDSSYEKFRLLLLLNDKIRSL